MDIHWVAHSVTFSDIYVIKLGNDIVASLKPKFYWRYVDDILTEEKLTRMTFFLND